MIGYGYMFYFCYLFYMANAETCIKPDKTEGKCILIKKCPELFSMLQNRTLLDKDIQYIRQFQCGFEGDHPKVCCSVEEPNIASDVNLPGLDVCGTNEQDRIIGGELTELNEFTWLALLEYDKPNGLRGFHCGGSLINDRFVLTAAHCVKRLPRFWKLVSIRLGEHNITSNPDCDNDEPGFDECAPTPLDIPIEQVIVHEQYKAAQIEQPHDIALLKLSRPVSYNKYLSPICLPNSDVLLKKTFVDLKLTVAGWGRTENRTRSEVKLKVEVPVKSATECGSIYKQSGISLIDEQLCAGGQRGKDSCTGDSGGPLMYLHKNSKTNNWFLSGIVSFGPKICGIQNWPGVYTRVTSYMPWIINKLKSYS